METFEHLRHWIAGNWTTPINSLISAFVGGMVSRLLPTREEARTKRRVRAEKEIDSLAHEALGNRFIWKGSRGMSGAGFPAVRTREIAEYLKLDPEAVSESLERLRSKGLAVKETGTLDDASPIWLYLPR